MNTNIIRKMSSLFLLSIFLIASSVSLESSSSIELPPSGERKLREGNYNHPSNENNIDCEKLSAYLQNMYPQCRDADEDMTSDSDSSSDGERPNDSSVHQSLIPVSFQVAVKQQLTMRELNFLRRMSSRALSRMLHAYTPFMVPKPDRRLDIKLLNWGDGQATRRQGGGDGSSGGNSSGGNSSGGNGGGGDSGKDDDAIDALRKSNIWLHHWHTGLSGDITTTRTDEIWYYPVEVEYISWWKDTKELITDKHLIHNVTKICWQVGNRTIATGELFEAIKLEGEKYVEENNDESNSSSSDDSEDDGFEWLLLDDEDAFALDGDDKAVENSNPYGIIIPTYPIPLERDWDKREYVGSLLFTATSIMALLLLGCSSRSQRPTIHTKSLEPHFLTEEGVTDILQVGWKYQKPKDGSTSQLFLQVYDKSKVGYNDSSSVLMGGVEHGAMADAALTDVTAPTERETNPTTRRESTTDSSNSRLPLSTTFTTSSTPEDIND
jgi:hypothetical protein